jgi:ABC-type Fe3+ transport system permease subunit
MTHSRNARFSASQLFWVGIIALVAGTPAAWFRTQSISVSLLMGLASAIISVAIVWFVGWTRRNG